MSPFYTLLSGCVFACLQSRTGNASPVNNSRIVGGKDTDVGEVPYTVSVECDYVHYCGGAIISDRFILTAAHCLMNQDISLATVRTGSSTLNYGGVNYKVKKMIPNPQYDRRTIDYDIGIMELAEPIRFNEKTKPIPLADSEPKGGEITTVSGWGVLNEGGQKPKILQSVKMPAKSRKECEQIFTQHNYTLRMICVGAPGKDACHGDSGGPAVANGKIVGVVSWGIGCARPDYAGVYANVANPDIRKFIKKYTNL